MMRCLILAGGLGTRLRSLLKDWPKPMAFVAGRPFLEYLLLYLKKYEITEIILSIAYQGDCIRNYFGHGEQWGLNIHYSYEHELRGTAGALKVARSLIREDDFLVMNGDSFFDIDLSALIRYHQTKGALATIALAIAKDITRYGNVEIDDTGKIVRFSEKRQEKRAGFINAGIYVLRRELLDLIPEGRAVSLEQEIFPRLVGKNFYGLPFQGYFVDIGVPEDYLRLQADPSRLLEAVGLKQ